MTGPASTLSHLQRILLSSGIVAPLLYLITDRVAGLVLKCQCFASRSMSELGVAGSPTRMVVVWLTVLSCAPMVALVPGSGG